jgi:HK97 family phage portal protein
MGIIAAAFAGADSQRAVNIIDLLKGSDAYRPSWSGKSVTVETAIRVSTVFACMRVIAEGVAQVPWKLMQQTDRTRVPARDDPLYNLLASAPNEFQTSFEFREQIVMHCVLVGNAYVFVNRSVRGEVLELIPLNPARVTPKQHADWSMTYKVRGDDGREREFPAEAIWHVRGPSWDGWQGLQAVKIAREAMGLDMAIEESQSRLHRNGVRASGTYSVSGTLKPDQWKALRDWIEENMGGAANAARPMVVDRDAKWLQTAMSGVDAQTLETRRYQVEEVCRFARVNPIMVGAESKNTTYASAEQMFLAHVVHTLSPWFTRIEQSADKALLSKRQRDARMYTNFVEEGLLRGSAKVTQEILLAYTNGGIMTVNESRDALDMNPDKDPASDRLRIPTNIVGNGNSTTGAAA